MSQSAMTLPCPYCNKMAVKQTVDAVRCPCGRTWESARQFYGSGYTLAMAIARERQDVREKYALNIRAKKYLDALEVTLGYNG